MNPFWNSFDLHFYSFFNTISVFAVFGFNFSQIERKRKLLSIRAQKIQKYLSNRFNNNFYTRVTFISIIEATLISIFQFAFTGIFNNLFAKIFGTGLNYFGAMTITPFLLILVCFLIQVNPLKQIDLITPAYPFALIFTKLACFCEGCCSGIEWEHGLYNYDTRQNEVPVQLFEVAFAVIIFVVLMCIRDRLKTGTAFPIYLIMYSSTRFFSEFFRVEPNVLWIFKTYHLLCIAGVIVGVIELILVNKFSDKINNYYDQKNKELKVRKVSKKKA